MSVLTVCRLESPLFSNMEKLTISPGNDKMAQKTLFISSGGELSIFSARSLESSCCACCNKCVLSLRVPGREGNAIEKKLVL